MVSFYYFCNFPDLKIRNYNNPKNSPCSLCKNNYMKSCECCFSSGNDALPDHFNPSGKVLVMSGQNIKSANYYDRAIHYLLNYEIDVINEKPDIKQFRQW